MILVSVGTTEKDFSRLIKSVDISLKNYHLIMQIGASKYQPVFHKWFKFKSSKEMNELILSSEIIVTHAGFGILSIALQYNKKLIITPREFKYNEAVNDQIELAKYLSKMYPKTIKMCTNFDDIEHLVIELMEYNNIFNYGLRSKIPELILNVLNNKM